MSVRTDFWLVQRLKNPWVVQPERGFDGYFSLDYMGSAEFEFGSVQESLKAIREAGDIEVFEHEVAVDGVTKPVFFVGPSKWLLDQVQNFQTWVDEGCQAKERPRFIEQFTDPQDWLVSTVAWWSLNSNVAWALDGDVAKTLKTAFETKRKDA